jgi:hypothetical protein
MVINILNECEFCINTVKPDKLEPENKESICLVLIN